MFKPRFLLIFSNLLYYFPKQKDIFAAFGSLTIVTGFIIIRLSYLERIAEYYRKYSELGGFYFQDMTTFIISIQKELKE